MYRDENKQIGFISYNHLNLPVEIQFQNGSTISYLYNAAGQKLRKLVSDMSTGGVSTTEYLDGFQYNNFILQFFSHPEGYVLNTPDKYGNPSFDYVYQYKDHLGNIRMNFVYAKGENDFILKVLEENHYYPFGLKHENYNTERRKMAWDVKLEGGEEIDFKKLQQVPNSGYQYKYNGKEWQDELGLNFYDYGARNYDPAIGRWMNMDRLAESFESITPYQYAGNTPTYYIDVNGDYIYINDTHQDGKQYRYQNGETQHQVDGKWVAIDSSVKLSAFVLHTIAGLHHLALSGETGAGLINDFSGAARSVEFNYERGRNEAVNGVNGGNDEIYLDHFNRPMTYTTASPKAQMTGLYLVIGHEMSHLTDPERFMTVVWYGKVATSEIRATHVENKIRAESGQPLRTHYGATKDKAGNLHPFDRSLLIDKAGNSLYYNSQGKRYSSPGVPSYEQDKATIQDINRILGGGILQGRFNYNNLRR
jgi:RHS repeat-associated protein